VKIQLFGHSGLVGGVLDLAVAVDFKDTAMEGVDCGFGAWGEGVEVGRDKFRSKELGCSTKKLYLAFDLVGDLTGRIWEDVIPSP
jgi:hypothetical protein